MVIDTIAKRLLFSTLRIEGKTADGGSQVGTAFLLSHDFPGYGTEVFIVTNKHVVDGVQRARLCFTVRKADQPVIGHTFAFECQFGFATVFHGHPSRDIDIAVLPISFLLNMASGADRDAFIMDLSTKSIPSRQEIDDFDAILPIVFVGYPDGLYDSLNCTPIFRRGTTATPFQFDYQGRPVFLIDASVFCGSSGSPVFTFETAWNGGIANVRLLGILAAVYSQRDYGEIIPVPAPVVTPNKVQISQMLDLGIVYKGHLILETILDLWERFGSELIRVKKN